MNHSMEVKIAQAVLPLMDRGEAPTGQRSGEASMAANGNGRSGGDHLMELMAALAARFTRHWWRVAAHEAFQAASPSATTMRKVSRDLPGNLNLPNRPVRTRMPGGVGGK
jgi:hypothetical protein